MKRTKWTYGLILGSALFAPIICSANDRHILVLDCTSSDVASDLTSKFPVVYLAGNAFDAAGFSEKGEITRTEFADLTQRGLKPPKGTIRFEIKKNDTMDVYIVTSVRMDTFDQAVATASPPLQWVSDPMEFVTANPFGASGPVTTSSKPVTISILKTARFLLKEQQRPTSLESGRDAKASAVLGVTFKSIPLLGPVLAQAPSAQKVFYYYRQRYKMKFENSIVTLSFEDQSGNQENVATVITGPSDNWYFSAGSPLLAYNPKTNDFGGNPTGLYLGLNWTPNDLYDPNARFLIVNFLNVNTTNPVSAIGLVGIGMGFPKTSHFIPLSTLSVTEVLTYNLDLSQFQVLTMISYDVSDVLQLLKL